MWDLKNINDNKKEILTKLKTCEDKKEKERLELTLATYICMLNNSGAIRYTKFYNFIEQVTKGKFSLMSPRNKLIIKGEKIISDSKDYLDENYLAFLLQIATNISKTQDVIEDESEIKFDSLNLSNEELIKISKLFYFELGDQEIYEASKKLLDSEDALNVSQSFISDMKLANGLTFNDYVFNKSYCTIIRENNIFDIQVLNHEVMHGIDFYVQPKIPTDNYYGFHEVPTYTIDYILIDYLENFGLDSQEIQKMRLKKDSYIQSLASLTLLQIKNEIARKKGIGYMKGYSTSDVMEVINPIILKQLLEIESGIIAFGLSKQYRVDNNLAITNLKQFMKQIIPKDKRPDFSHLGMNDETLMELSMEFGTYSLENKEYVGKGK